MSDTQVVLRPCPFCGAQGDWPIPLVDDGHNKGGWFISCSDCDGTIYGKNEQDTADKWNRRQADEDLEQLRGKVRRLEQQLADLGNPGPRANALDGNRMESLNRPGRSRLDRREW